MNNFDENKVNRHLAGTAGGKGGKFAKGDDMRDEAGQVALDEPQYKSPVDLMSDEELLDMSSNLGSRIFHNSSRMARHQAHIDGDDIGQDIALEALVKRQKVQEALANGQKVKYIEKPYMAKAAKSRERDHAALYVHPNNRKALAILNRLEDEYHREHGHYMPSKLRDQRAEEITMAEPAGRRPTQGWQNLKRFGQTVPLVVDSVSSPGAASSTGGGYLNPAVEHSVDRDNAFTRHFDVDADGNVHTEGAGGDSFVADGFEAQEKTDRKKMLWMALSAQREGLPTIASGTLTRTQASKASVTLESEGGAGVVAQRWLEGDLGDDHPAVESMFAPFGNASYREQNEVAELLSEHKDYSGDLWKHCLSEARK